MRAELVLEAVRRGEHTERGWTPREWVFEHCPSLRQGGFAQLAKIVWETAGSTTIPAGVDYNDQSVAFDRDAPLAIAWEQVRTGVTTPTIALGALREVDRLLAVAGTDKTRILSAQIWLADMGDFAAMNAVWDNWVPEGTAPVRACISARLANPGYRIEAVVVAARN